jgi:ferredoxin-thioredoxin reductase catalytic subunit
MKVYFNPDEKITNAIRLAVKKKDGYCPCRLDKVEDNYCMCKEFRDQIADPNFEGFCHCRLYYKEK